MDFNFDLGNWLNIASHYPDIVALVVGTLVGYTFTATVETYFIPITTDPAVLRKYQGLTFILCWLVSGACSAILWAYLDPSDLPTKRIVVSYIVAVLSFTAYPFLARLISAFFPRIGTAWEKQEDNNRN